MPARGYRSQPEEAAAVTEAFIERLDLSGITVVIHDWGGQIGGPPQHAARTGSTASSSVTHGRGRSMATCTSSCSLTCWPGLSGES